MRWQHTFDRLDRISRQRALTDAESAMLERAIEEVDRKATPVVRTQKRWTPSEVVAFVRLISVDQCSVSEAARRMGRTRNAGLGKWHRLQKANAA